MNASPNSLINKFNSLNSKSILHIKDMKNLKTYQIIKAFRTTTKFGQCIQIELDNHIMFLPNRYNAMTDEEIMELTSDNYFLKKEVGEDEKSFRLLLERFNINDDEFIILQNGQYPIWN